MAPFALILESPGSPYLELAQTLSFELAGLGEDSHLYIGTLPSPKQRSCCVVFGPHRFASQTWYDFAWFQTILERSVHVTGEIPGDPEFVPELAMTRRARSVLTLSESSAHFLRQNGVLASKLPIGPSAAWRPQPLGTERDIDLLFMGRGSPVRSRALASSARHLWKHRNHILISDGGEPYFHDGTTFLSRAGQWQLLARSKLLLHVHYGPDHSFPSMAALQATLSGCALVTEHALDHLPLEPGRHYISASAPNLVFAADELLCDAERRKQLVTAALASWHQQVPMRSSAQLVRRAAREVGPVGSQVRRIQAPLPASGEGEFIDEAADAQILELRRRHVHPDGRASAAEIAAERARSGGPRISVLVSVYNYAADVQRALDSVIVQDFTDTELVIVDDASTDDSYTKVREWLAHHPEIRAQHIRHSRNVGTARARNTALAHARAPMAFVLDADDYIYPYCLSRLATALETDQSASFAYGIVETVVGGHSRDLLSTQPWSLSRLSRGPYICSMALFRTEALRQAGGYTVDPAFDTGWEDYELWCRLADRGYDGALVREIVAQYWIKPGSRSEKANLSHAGHWEALTRLYPDLVGEPGLPA